MRLLDLQNEVRSVGQLLSTQSFRIPRVQSRRIHRSVEARLRVRVTAKLHSGKQEQHLQKGWFEEVQVRNLLRLRQDWQKKEEIRASFRVLSWMSQLLKKTP